MSNNLILAIDPGPEMSGVVRCDFARTGTPLIDYSHAYANVDLVEMIMRQPIASLTCIVENIEPHYGRPVGVTTHETLRWIGEFRLAWRIYEGNLDRFYCVPPTTWRRQLTGINNPTPARVHAALYSRYGGDRKAAVGTKRKPGPLYGLRDHAWDALGLAVAWHEMQELEKQKRP